LPTFFSDWLNSFLNRLAFDFTFLPLADSWLFNSAINSFTRDGVNATSPSVLITISSKARNGIDWPWQISLPLVAWPAQV
jgi:hypothetical protein